MRHGKAEDPKALQRDFDRKLSEHGKKEVAKTTQQLLEEKIIPHVVICSAALRTSQTAEIAAKVLGYPEKEIDKRLNLYDGPTEMYIDSIKELPDELDTALLIGHNPVIAQTLTYLSTENTDFPTAAIAVVQLNCKSWEDVEISNAKLLASFHP